MKMSIEHPNEIWLGFIILENQKMEEPEFSFKMVERKDICEISNYKYMITIDGNVSPWARGPLILYSDSVPIVVETESTPLYQKFWTPWIHYVPVKNDLSDLIEIINWLRDNDDKAKEIALNGKSLFKKLYNMPKMLEDTASVYAKYSSLMKYVPEKPDKTLLYKPQILPLTGVDYYYIKGNEK